MHAEDWVQRGFRIRGAVQGVGFRWWTRRLAQELGVHGSVRNCPDGSVEVRAGASASVLEEFAARLKAGPPAARVRAMEAFPTDDVAPEGFRISHWP